MRNTKINQNNNKFLGIFPGEEGIARHCCTCSSSQSDEVIQTVSAIYKALTELGVILSATQDASLSPEGQGALAQHIARVQARHLARGRDGCVGVGVKRGKYMSGREHLHSTLN